MSNEAVVFSGKEQVATYQILVLRSALKLYAKTKMKVNSAYTPKNMLATATALTGKPFKRGQYQQAIDALTALLPPPAPTQANHRSPFGPSC